MLSPRPQFFLPLPFGFSMLTRHGLGEMGAMAEEVNTGFILYPQKRAFLFRTTLIVFSESLKDLGEVRPELWGTKRSFQ